jgi:hypothetical protein
MAENNNGFTDGLSKVTGFVNTNLIDRLLVSDQTGETRFFHLKEQPTPDILNAVDSFLRQAHSDLKLCWYELAEVNRFSYEAARTISPNTKPTGQYLRDYWNGLGSVAPANRTSVPFMEAVGALSSDQWTRDQMRATGPQFLNRWFDVTSDQSTGLFQALRDNSPAEIAALGFFNGSWPGSGCASVVTADPNWVHVNK